MSSFKNDQTTESSKHIDFYFFLKSNYACLFKFDIYVIRHREREISIQKTKPLYK